MNSFQAYLKYEFLGPHSRPFWCRFKWKWPRKTFLLNYILLRYYRTTDSPPILATEKCAEKTDQAATRFWVYSVIRPLTVGILQLLADYFIKPLLSIIFNALIQPVLILLYNIATSLRDLCEPIAEAMGLFLRELANVCAAIRIVEVKQGTAPSAVCTLYWLDRWNHCVLQGPSLSSGCFLIIRIILIIKLQSKLKLFQLVTDILLNVSFAK